MPMYDYRCSNCNKQFIDVLLPITRRDEPLHEACPSCNIQGAIEHMPGAPGIGDAVRLGRANLPTAWTDKLANMKSNYHRSTINVPSPGKREI